MSPLTWICSPAAYKFTRVSPEVPLGDLVPVHLRRNPALLPAVHLLQLADVGSFDRCRGGGVVERQGGGVAGLRPQLIGWDGPHAAGGLLLFLLLCLLLLRILLLLLSLLLLQLLLVVLDGRRRHGL